MSDNRVQFPSYPPYVADSDTSRAAAASMKPHTPYLRDRIMRLFDDRMPTEYDVVVHGRQIGWTCDEIETELGASHQTVSPRVYELARSGAIVDSGERRKTKTGRKATVWKKKNQ